jgi:subtilisin family serine protease
VNVRITACVFTLWLAAVWAYPVCATEPGVAAATPHLPRIIVGFANAPYTLPGPAGTTGSRYNGGDGYRIAQSAHSQAQRVAAAYALHEVASWPIEALGLHCVVYEITNGRPMPEVLASLSKDARVVLAQPLQEFRTLTGPASAAPATATAAPPYNDPLYDLQTNLVALGIARAHLRAQGAGVRIALIDTGVDGAHPDLRGRIIRTASFTPSRPRRPSDLRHGTAMAGIIAAVANNHVGIVGIAPLARLEVFEACWQLDPASDAATCNTFTLAQALAGALAAGTPLVNLSLGGPADPLLTALVNSGIRRGVIFVAAAAPQAGFPGSIPGVIRAAGTEEPLPQGSFAAPAVHVLTTRPDGQYDFESGTSVACAEITGIIALLMSATPTHLTGGAITALLSGGEHVAGQAANSPGDPPPVDVNAALSRLDARMQAAR